MRMLRDELDRVWSAKEHDHAREAVVLKKIRMILMENKHGQSHSKGTGWDDQPPVAGREVGESDIEGSGCGEADSQAVRTGGGLSVRQTEEPQGAVRDTARDLRYGDIVELDGGTYRFIKYADGLVLCNERGDYDIVQRPARLLHHAGLSGVGGGRDLSKVAIPLRSTLAPRKQDSSQPKQARRPLDLSRVETV